LELPLLINILFLNLANMKRIIVLFVLTTLIAVACTKKSIPTTSGSGSGAATSPTKTTGAEKKSEPDKTSEPDKPSVAAQPTAPTAPTVPNKPSDEEMGKNVYTTKCGKCHALKNVGSFTYTQWEGILKSMVPKAKLTADEENQVVAYIKSNSK
jgi:mono/diheme cytochrome c family protein